MKQKTNLIFHKIKRLLSCSEIREKLILENSFGENKESQHIQIQVHDIDIGKKQNERTYHLIKRDILFDDDVSGKIRFTEIWSAPLILVLLSIMLITIFLWTNRDASPWNISYQINTSKLKEEEKYVDSISNIEEDLNMIQFSIDPHKILSELQGINNSFNHIILFQCESQSDKEELKHNLEDKFDFDLDERRIEFSSTRLANYFALKLELEESTQMFIILSNDEFKPLLKKIEIYFEITDFKFTAIDRFELKLASITLNRLLEVIKDIRCCFEINSESYSSISDFYLKVDFATFELHKGVITRDTYFNIIISTLKDLREYILDGKYNEEDIKPDCLVD